MRHVPLCRACGLDPRLGEPLLLRAGEICNPHLDRDRCRRTHGREVHAQAPRPRYVAYGPSLRAPQDEELPDRDTGPARACRRSRDLGHPCAGAWACARLARPSPDAAVLPECIPQRGIHGGRLHCRSERRLPSRDCRHRRGPCPRHRLPHGDRRRDSEAQPPPRRLCNLSQELRGHRAPA